MHKAFFERIYWKAVSTSLFTEQNVPQWNSNENYLQFPLSKKQSNTKMNNKMKKKSERKGQSLVLFWVSREAKEGFWMEKDMNFF